jgi:hypothetical protein
MDKIIHGGYLTGNGRIRLYKGVSPDYFHRRKK